MTVDGCRTHFNMQPLAASRVHKVPSACVEGLQQTPPSLVRKKGANYVLGAHEIQRHGRHAS